MKNLCIYHQCLILRQLWFCFDQCHSIWNSILDFQSPEYFQSHTTPVTCSPIYHPDVMDGDRCRHFSHFVSVSIFFEILHWIIQFWKRQFRLLFWLLSTKRKKTFENIVGKKKKKTANNQHFYPFCTIFSHLPNTNFNFWVTLIVRSHFLVYTLASTNINQSAPNLFKMYMTIRSQMSLIMELIGLQLSELSALELENLSFLTLFTL